VHTVVGRINTGNAVFLQFFDLLGKDDAASASENFDVPEPLFFQHVVHVFEEFHVTPLVRGNGNGLDIFLNGGIDNFMNRTVVPQMNHFGPRRLDDPSHNIDGGVVSVKQRSGCYDPNVMLRLINFW